MKSSCSYHYISSFDDYDEIASLVDSVFSSTSDDALDFLQVLGPKKDQESQREETKIPKRKFDDYCQSTCNINEGDLSSNDINETSYGWFVDTDSVSDDEDSYLWRMKKVRAAHRSFESPVERAVHHFAEDVRWAFAADIVDEVLSDSSFSSMSYVAKSINTLSQ